MDILRVKRAPLRAAFTRVHNALTKKLSDENPIEKEVQTLIEQLISAADKLREADDEYLKEMLKAKVNEDEYTLEYEACDLYANKLISAKVDVKYFFASKRNGESPRQEELESGNPHSLMNDSARYANNGLKLPKINLIQFDGDPRNWLNWWNTFQKIHTDDSLDQHTKFVYLLQSTVPDSKAREIVNSFPATSENYPKAIEHLKNRFGREDILIQIYVRDLLQLVLQNYGARKNSLNLSALYDSLETKLRALESLGVKKDKYDCLLFPLVESSLPPETLRVWERSRDSNKTEVSDLESLLNFLKSEVLTEERVSLACDNFGLSKSKKYSKYNDFIESEIPTSSELCITGRPKQINFVKKVDDCLICTKPHSTDKCYKAKTLSYEEKKDLLYKKGVCLICMKKSHFARNCPSRAKCAICRQTSHSTFLCRQAPRNAKVATPAESASSVLSNSCSLNQSVLLQTLVVKLTHGKKHKYIRAIIDTGAGKSFLSKDVINYLGYKPVKSTKLIHRLFGGIETDVKSHDVFKIKVESIANDFSIEMFCLDELVICSEVGRIPKGPWISEMRANNIRVTDLQDYFPGVENEIKLLIGADVAGKLYTGKIKCLNSGPVAMETRLGYILMGQIPDNNANENEISACVSLLLNDRSAENFWRLDTLGITDPIESKTKAELHLETMVHFKDNLKVNDEGRYEVALPWVLENSRLPTNRELAEKRLDSTRGKLIKADKIEMYQEVIDDWTKDNIIEEVDYKNVLNEHYLPHRPVFKESSETTKVRPVFDASAHSQGNVSLNDCLEKGPNLIELIPSLINRFRKFPIGVVSDIEKAFLQISIIEKDRDFLRFLWKGINDQDVKIYHHNRVVFGLNCSPFLLGATINCHLDNATEEFADAAKTLKESFYVDNCLTSFETVDELDEFVMHSRTLLSAAKFNLRSWRTNGESRVISQTGEEKIICVLGLDWNLTNDTLSCKLESHAEKNIIASKRTLLSCTNKLFDPIGFTSPVTLFPRLALQESWKLKLKWDEKLPEQLEKQFHIWISKMNLLTEIKIPRWINYETSSQGEISLHVFCDASSKAYATCIFLRVKKGQHVSVNFVQARSRVAPLRNVSIPRLELLSCTIGARLGSTVTSDLRIEGLKHFYWCDSTTALSWIQRDVRWGTFVWNRVQEIRTLTKIEDWRHVPTELNSADLPSRGCSVEHFQKSKWWEGPSFLKNPEETWPCNIVTPDEEIVSSEIRKTVLVTHEKSSQPNNWYYRYFSSYPKTLRLVAWISRFVNNARKIDIYKESELSFSEIQRAERILFKLIQKESFVNSGEGNFKNLSLIVDEYGVLRVKTPVMHRKDTDDFKYPVLLPSDHPVVHRLIFWQHNEMLHAGVSLLMTSLRERFWIVKARKTVRAVIYHCVRCKRFNAKRTESIPIALPADRVEDVAVFQVTGVDLAGPLYLKRGRKSWIVLYTCAVYRAIHLELVTTLSTESFLQSFRRFIARKGRPTTVYSDNGGNFVGANSDLSSIDWDHVSTVSSLQRIRWKFNPPSAAWWGGWWERLIQLVKRILRKVLGQAVLSYEELSTILCDCEQVLNSRPLTYVTEDAEDLSPLTPAMFMQPLKSSDVDDIDLVDSQGLNKRLKFLHKIREHLRQRFRCEYLGQLKQQMSFPKNVKPLSVNDVVLLESDQKRAKWALARIMKLYPGKDGHHRVARVKTQTGEYIRPVQRLYNLEVQRDLNSDPIVRTRSGRQILAPNRLGY